MSVQFAKKGVGENTIRERDRTTERLQDKGKRGKERGEKKKQKAELIELDRNSRLIFQ